MNADKVVQCTALSAFMAVENLDKWKHFTDTTTWVYTIHLIKFSNVLSFSVMSESHTPIKMMQQFRWNQILFDVKINVHVGDIGLINWVKFKTK